MPFSYHSHSGEFCMHAKQDETLEDMVQTAIQKRMKVYSLTEHAPRDQPGDMYPEEVAATKTPFDLFTAFFNYINAALRLRAKYQGQIQLLIGMEAEYIRPSSIDIIRTIQQTHPVFDLIIGSVHHVNTIPIDFDRQKYLEALDSVGGSEDALFAAYFDAQYTMITEIQPAVVAHFDLIRLFSNNPNKPLADYGVWDKVERNIQAVLEYGGLLELNSASLRKGWATPYPKEDVSQRFLQMGGRFTLSDDAHAVSQVGLNYHLVYQYLLQLGATHIHYLERLPMGEIGVNVLGPCAVRAMSLEELGSDPFWLPPDLTPAASMQPGWM